ncbi:hypothetical protein VA249_41210 [Vibrio alfacsensis]|uniref:TlpA disulfide reductase family protein n=1 Tax=Vibrio alfacsensis TaxID=1074311 RepID=UPI001BEDFB2F|nr:thioredoxin domain-containing protein [Vibrio alfacsensis]BBM67475.1 hypothetical protein VA249_41210 [Vibrio alfacsensis]
MSKNLKRSYAMFTLIMLSVFGVNTDSLASQCPTPAPFTPVTIASENLPNAIQNPIHTPVSVVNLWAIWCTPCRKELPMLVALHRALEDKVSLSAIHVGAMNEQVTNAIETLGATKLNQGHMDDFSQLNQIGIHGLPATLIMLQGEVRYIGNGYLAESMENYQQWLLCLEENIGES